METGRYTEDENKIKKGFGKKKEGKTDKKDKGYIMFEEENSEEEILVSKENKTPMKLKKHSKPSFKFAKRPKEKEKDKEEKRKDDKEKKVKDKDEKGKSKKKKFGSLSSMGSIHKTEQTEESPVFGVPLEVAVKRNRSHDGILLPAVFRECIDYIEEYGLTCEGIYRISGVKSKVQSLKEAYNKQIPVYLKEYEPSVVASLLKQFLRELPEPVLTSELMPKFEQACTIKSVKQKVEEFQNLIEKLPDYNRSLLSWTIVHMTHVIARENQNKMSLQNVSIVLSPTMQISHRVLNVLFTYSKILFKDTGIKKYVPPLKPVTSRWSLDLPDSPNSLEEELHKQESLLDELHKELMKVKDTNKEEQLWEVQRVVTGLKRKLKLMKKAQEGTPGRSPKLHKPLPPTSLDLKLKHKIESKQKTSSEISSQSNENNAVSAKATTVEKKTPSKPMTLDFGDIEEDISAQSERNRTESPDVVANPDLENISAIVQKINQGKRSDPKHVSDNDPHDDNIEEEVDPEITVSNNSIDNTLASEPTEIKGDETDDIVVNKAFKSESGAENATENDVVLEDIKNSEQAESLDNSISSQTDIVVVDAKKTNELHLEADSGHSLKDDEMVNVISEPDDKDMDQSMINTISRVEEFEERTSEKGEEKEIEIIVNEINEKEKLAKTEIDSGKASDEDLHQHLEKLGIPMTEPPDNTAEERDIGAADGGMTGGVEPEKLAAALSELVQESEEDINQRVMSEFVQDFGIEKTESLEQDEEYMQMLQEQQALLLEEEELCAIADELRQKIETEQNETERLREEIMEIQVMREDIYSSDYNSSSADSDSDEDSLDGEDLESMLFTLTRENNSLEIQNRDLCDKIHQERQICLEVKVQIRMVQAKQLESSMNNQLDLLL